MNIKFQLKYYPLDNLQVGVGVCKLMNDFFFVDLLRDFFKGGNGSIYLFLKHAISLKILF